MLFPTYINGFDRQDYVKITLSHSLSETLSLGLAQVFLKYTRISGRHTLPIDTLIAVCAIKKSAQFLQSLQSLLGFRCVKT